MQEPRKRQVQERFLLLVWTRSSHQERCQRGEARRRPQASTTRTRPPRQERRPQEEAGRRQQACVPQVRSRRTLTEGVPTRHEGRGRCGQGLRHDNQPRCGGRCFTTTPGAGGTAEGEHCHADADSREHGGLHIHGHGFFAALRSEGPPLQHTGRLSRCTCGGRRIKARLQGGKMVPRHGVWPSVAERVMLG